MLSGAHLLKITYEREETWQSARRCGGVGR
jgi:hypothetical protein